MACGHLVSIPGEPTAVGRMADLAAALEFEVTVLDRVRLALLRQRAGVAAADQDMIDAGLHAMGRSLLTLDEARRRRATLTALILGEEIARLDRHGVVPDGRFTPEVDLAGERMKRASLRAMEEAAINQHILRGVLEAGDAFLQRLFSMSAEPEPGPQGDPRAAAVS